MLVCVNDENIYDIKSWFKVAPPQGGEKQWKDGRSAKELARYITISMEHLPIDIENDFLSLNIDTRSDIMWGAEYITEFSKYGLGRGGGRHHDAVFYNKKVFVGIEAKADESLDRLVEEVICDCTKNKLLRVNKLCDMIWGEECVNHGGIRYQLITALCGVMLESVNHYGDTVIPTAVLEILTFKKQGDDGKKPYYDRKKIEQNICDIEIFLASLRYWDKKTGEIHTKYSDENNIKVFVRHHEIEVK